MDRVLDLDLDFFVWPIAWSAKGGRLSEDEHTTATPEQVSRFLREQCGLSRRLPGRFVENHDDAFFAWRDWIADGVLSTPFEVVHVDAHADLGLHESAYLYLMTEFLDLPVGQRREPRRGPGALTAGSYLPFAIACRWLAKLVYVYPEDKRPPSVMARFPTLSGTAGNFESSVKRAPDLMPLLFKNCDTTTSTIQLRHYSDRSAMDGEPDEWALPLSYEPEVPFAAIPECEFRSDGFTHITLARSPDYTPRSADGLIPTIGRYIEPR